MIKVSKWDQRSKFNTWKISFEKWIIARKRIFSKDWFSEFLCFPHLKRNPTLKGSKTWNKPNYRDAGHQSTPHMSLYKHLQYYKLLPFRAQTVVLGFKLIISTNITQKSPSSKDTIDWQLSKKRSQCCVREHEHSSNMESHFLHCLDI